MTLERTKSAAERIKGNKLTQAALAKTADQLAALQVTAAKAGEVVAKHIDAAVSKVDQAMAGTSSKVAEAAATAAAVAGVKEGRAAAEESFDDAGEAEEAAAAAAAGDIVDVALFAPGRLLYVKAVDEGAEEAQQHFELVDGHGGKPLHHLMRWLIADQQSQSLCTV